MEPAFIKKETDRITGGLFLMIVFTAMWAIIAENSLRGKDHWVIGIFFAGILIVFIRYYLKLNAEAKKLPVQPEIPETDEEKKQGKWFMIIFGIEGIAILATLIVLNILHLARYFIPCYALIVGLHFFPLGWLFKRSFDFFMGTWTCMIAVAGIILMNKQQLPALLVVAFVGAGCAIATSSYGFRMIGEGRKLGNGAV